MEQWFRQCAKLHQSMRWLVSTHVTMVTELEDPNYAPALRVVNGLITTQWSALVSAAIFHSHWMKLYLSLPPSIVKCFHRKFCCHFKVVLPSTYKVLKGCHLSALVIPTGFWTLNKEWTTLPVCLNVFSASITIREALTHFCYFKLFLSFYLCWKAIIWNHLPLKMNLYVKQCVSAYLGGTSITFREI